MSCSIWRVEGHARRFAASVTLSSGKLAMICAQVCRTYNFGERGSSKGQFYYDYLRPIKLNDVNIDWGKMVCSLPLSPHAPGFPVHGQFWFLFTLCSILRLQKG